MPETVSKGSNVIYPVPACNIMHVHWKTLTTCTHKQGVDNGRCPGSI